MSVWTVLVVTFTVPIINQTSELRIPFPSQQECGEAMNAIYYPVIYKQYRESIAQCEQSRTISSSPRPKPRPEGIK